MFQFTMEELALAPGMAAVLVPPHASAIAATSSVGSYYVFEEHSIFFISLTNSKLSG